MLGWFEGVLPEWPPHAARLIASVISSNRTFLTARPPTPMSSSGKGARMASCIPDCQTALCIAVMAATVIVVVWVEAPATVAGAKLQLHPAGKPEQANDKLAEKPLLGVTVTTREPGFAWLTESAALDSVSA